MCTVYSCWQVECSIFIAGLEITIEQCKLTNKFYHIWYM